MNKRAVSKRRRQPQAEEWHKSNLFWGSAGFCLTFVLAAIGFGASGRTILAHSLFVAALPCGVIACWSASKNLIRYRPALRLLILLILASCLYGADRAATHLARAHIHIIAVDLIIPSPDDVIRSKVHLQNDGDAAIVSYINCRVVGVTKYSVDPKAQADTENSIFDLATHGKNCQSGLPNAVPAHSIELTSDVTGITPVPLTFVQGVARGDFAVYSAGSIAYVDESHHERHSSYCYWTNGLVEGMKLCFVHNEEP
jgi:hypothetical protein